MGVILHSTQDSKYFIKATFSIVPNLPSIPSITIRHHQRTTSLRPLADQTLGKRSPLDMIISTSTFTKVMKQETSRHPDGHFCAMITIFGWTVMGGSQHSTSSATIMRLDAQPSLDHLLSKLWKHEELPMI